MPGQTVNTLQVPMEKTLRQRSASLSSMRANDYMTMNPRDKFVTPRPAPPVPGQSALRLDSCPGQVLRHKTSARSLSPTPTWRRFFRKSSRDEKDFVMDDARSISSRGSIASGSIAAESMSFNAGSLNVASNPSRASSSSRSRDISPESLLRFLSDDSILLSPSEERPALFIPDDIVEENEDDENFASSATAENPAFATCLSPPPFRRSESAPYLPTTSHSSHAATEECAVEEAPESPVIPSFHFEPRSRFSFSSVSSYAPSEAATPDMDTPSFYDSLDDDLLSEGDASQPLSPMPPKESLEQSYSLPQAETSASKAPMLAAPPIDAGLGDLAAELGWMVDIISGKN